MHRLAHSTWFAALTCLLILNGCVSHPHPTVERQIGESVVFIGQQPAALAHLPMAGQPIDVRNTYLVEPGTLHYEEGRDYIVDARAGTLHRTAGSRLPDFRTNMLHGHLEFDHRDFPGFGNAAYFAFVDYRYAPASPWPVQPGQARLLPRSQARLQAGQSLKIVAFGDSITAGGDATRPELVFWERWAEGLRRKYPNAPITAMNGATGGDSTVQGLQRLQGKVVQHQPDLVLVAFGMNDHNRGSVEPLQFELNLKELITRIRSATTAEIILLSTFPPNPHWKFGSGRMAQYAEATARVAQEYGCAYADIFRNWQTLAARKKPEDLLGNNINHPNDFGHWIYLRVLESLDL